MRHQGNHAVGIVYFKHVVRLYIGSFSYAKRDGDLVFLTDSYFCHFSVFCMFIKSYRSIKILLTVSKIYSGGSQFPSLFLVRPPDFSPIFISSSPSGYPAKKELPVTNKKHVYENVVLLLASNILMTYAWYGHLKNMQHKPLVQAVPDFSRLHVIFRHSDGQMFPP